MLVSAPVFSGLPLPPVYKRCNSRFGFCGTIESLLSPSVDQIKQGAKQGRHKNSQADGQNARFCAPVGTMAATFKFQAGHASSDSFARQALPAALLNRKRSAGTGEYPPVLRKICAGQLKINPRAPAADGIRIFLKSPRMAGNSLEPEIIRGSMRPISIGTELLKLCV